MPAQVGHGRGKRRDGRAGSCGPRHGIVHGRGHCCGRVETVVYHKERVVPKCHDGHSRGAGARGQGRGSRRRQSAKKIEKTVRAWTWRLLECNNGESIGRKTRRGRLIVVTRDAEAAHPGECADCVCVAGVVIAKAVQPSAYVRDQLCSMTYFGVKRVMNAGMNQLPIGIPEAVSDKRRAVC
jgi:hypothetical protein